MNEIRIDNKTYTLNEGESVLIFPFQTHSYTMKTEVEEHSICIFSPGLVSGFYNKVKDKLPTDNKFIIRLTQDIILDNCFHERAFAYFLCGEFDKNRDYVEKSLEFKENYFEELLLYVNQNLSKDCLLKDAAEYIGYDYAYISKTFKRKVGISFRQYINNLRIIESKRLLKATVQGIEEIAEKCGFSSLRTFDREFREQTGTTPSEYRKKHKKA